MQVDESELVKWIGELAVESVQTFEVFDKLGVGADDSSQLANQVGPVGWQRLLEERMTAVVIEAQQSGLGDGEFFALIRDVWQSVQQKDGFNSRIVPQG